MNSLLFSKVICLDQSKSTNDDAFAVLEKAPSCLVWTTDQTAGRGSRGRGWLSPAGCHLALTLAFDANGFPAPGELCYPLLAGVAVYDTLRQLNPKAPLSLKWPNDVMLSGLKCAGILCESRWVRDQVRIAIGIGINLKSHPSLAGLPKGYAALASLPQPPAPVQIIDALKTIFAKTLADHTRPETLNKAWLLRSGLPVGTPLRIKANGATLEGSFAGLDQDGALMLWDAQQHVHRIAQSCDDFDILPSLG